MGAEAKMNWVRHANEDADEKVDKEKDVRARGGSGTDIAVDESRKERADRVKRHQRDSSISGTCAI